MDEDRDLLLPPDTENADTGIESQENTFNNSVWEKSTCEIIVTHFREYFNTNNASICKNIFQWILVILQ